ncbi:hypothetical protein K2173_028118 [Erythroxylum novogranatense]|uniref:DUF4228 domain protein n=1 Tax=Erythroxylum novogranatense TaxID=1862640 RepID=A0AAV8U0Z0_9ROSI|nr:hypothetical protein K2173_028118 [Erythroxylum novogranatense]
MGNCQAVDAATLVVQHPSGKVERFYLPVSASEIMKMNPGHYVALLLSTTLYPSTTNAQQCPNNRSTDDTHTHSSNNGSVRLTRIKLLKPTDTLALGHVYRLITTQEVMKGLRAKKQAKLMQNQSESGERLERAREKQTSGLDSEQKDLSLMREIR